METTQQKLDRLNALSESGVLNDWESNFTISVIDQYKQRNLTDNQHRHINKIIAKNDPEVIKARNDWYASYNDEKREIARKAAEYYKANPPYYQQLADKILDNPEYVPSESSFNKITQNKYVQRYLKALETGPQFEPGQMVRFRRNADVRYHHRKFVRNIEPNLGTPSSKWQDLSGKLAVVIEISGQPGAAAGSRPYTVLPVGQTIPVETLERRLMNAK